MKDGFSDRGSVIHARYSALLNLNDPAVLARKEEVEGRTHREKVEYTLKNHRSWLYKQGHVVKNWKLRYFIVKGEMLQYYTDDTLAPTKQKGSFSLKDCQLVLDITVEGRDHCFMVKPMGGLKEYLLSAHSKEEKQAWLDAISFICNGSLPSYAYDLNESPKTQTQTQMKIKGERTPKRGWLEKQGHVKKNWKWRWFTLSAARLADSLNYYDLNSGVGKKGCIGLKNSSVSKVVDIKEKQNCFVVHTKPLNQQPKEYFLSAKTTEECDEWISLINQAILALEHEHLYLDFFFKE